MTLKNHAILAARTLLVLACLAADSPAQAAMRVLIVTGLAGEAAQFERQAVELDGWRKIFAASGIAADALTVIRSPQVADDPAAAGKPPVQRQILDSLAGWKETVTPEDDVCLVFIGRVAQFGKERFFQVRGPRLSAGALAAALDEIPARSQTIFLTGPGSGGFARDVAADNRVIVSATNDDRELNGTRFGAAWCQAALAAPNGTILEWLAAAEAEIDREIKERTLARTEHAMLLVGRRKPVEAPFEVALTDEQRAAWTLSRPFVPVTAAAAIAAVPAQPSERAQAPEPSRPATAQPPAASPRATAADEPPAPPQRPATPDQPDAPKARHTHMTSRQATAEERELLAAVPDRTAYPDQPGVILLKSLETVVAENLSSRHATRLRLAVFDPAGMRDMIDRAIAVPIVGQGRILDLKTILPTGETLEVHPWWLASLRREPKPGGEPPRIVPRFAPGVVPGAVVEFGYEVAAPTPSLPSYFAEITLAEPVPVKTLSVRLATPAAKNFRHAFLDIDTVPGIDPQAFAVDASNPFNAARTWTWRDLPALPAERGQPARGGPMPRLAVSGYRSWDEFIDWARRLTRADDEVSPDVERTARELTAGLETDEEKIRALYAYVAGLRYVALEGGANAWRPRFADSVLLQQYGDCKDKVTLLVALLRAVGITGHMALVRRAAPFTEEPPGCSFDHAVMAVERPAGLLWLDPIDEVCPYGMLPPGDAGQRALLMSGAGGFHTVPAFHAGYDRETRCEADLELAADSRTARGTVRLSFAGLQDYEWRGRLRHLSADEFRRELARHARSVWPGVVVEAIEWTGARNLDEPLRVELTVAVPAVDPVTDAIRLPGAWLPLAAEVDAWPRRTPQALNGGYPLAFRQVVTLRHPPGMVPEMAKHPLPDDPTVRVGITDAVEPGRIRRTSTLAIDPAVIPPAAIPACRRALDAWEAGMAAPIPTNAKRPQQ